MNNCIFCRIAKGEFGTDFLYKDEDIVAFEDISKVAPVHFLVVPRKHIKNVLDISESGYLLAKIFTVIKKLVKHKYKIEDSGFRIVTNCNEDGGQTVFHLHFHVLGGRSLSWPPG